MSERKVKSVKVSIEVELTNGEKLTHCSIAVDLSGSQALVDVQQMDYPGADEFTRSWLKSALDTHGKKNDLNRVPDKLN